MNFGSWTSGLSYLLILAKSFHQVKDGFVPRKNVTIAVLYCTVLDTVVLLYQEAKPGTKELPLFLSTFLFL